MKLNALVLYFHCTLVLTQFAHVETFGQEMIKRYQCSLNNEFHHTSACSSLLRCDGGKIKMIKDTLGLKPCHLCASPKIIEEGFKDIRIPLSFSDKEHVIDVLGRGEHDGRYRLKGYVLKLTTRPVRSVEYSFSKTVYDEKSMINNEYFQTLGLNFSGCKADTLGYRNVAMEPAGKFYTIAYRGSCVIAEQMAKGDNLTYFYELRFQILRFDPTSSLDQIVLTLRPE